MNRRQRRLTQKQGRSQQPQGFAPALQQRFKLALHHHQAGRLAEAEPLYRQVLAAAPHHADSLQLLGVLSYQTGRAEAAVALIGQAIQIISDNPAYLNNLGCALKAQGKLDDAIARYTEALRLKPDYPEALNNLGTALQAQGKLDDAIARYTDALGLKPDYPDALNNLGLALQAQGKLEDAIARYTEALRLKPDYPEVLNNLGLALQAQGKLDDAIARYTEALRLKPDYPDALNNLGLALHHQAGRLAETWTLSTQAIAASGVEESPQGRGMFEQQLTFVAPGLAAGNLAASEIVCRDILDMDPYNSAALNLLGVVAARVGALDQSAAYFEAALRAEPNNEDVRKNLNLLKNAFRSHGKKNPADQYLVIKSWGFGFWSDVSQVLGSLLLAEITGRIPVTHWGKNSLFSDGSNRDAFEIYFKPVSNVTLPDLAHIDSATYFPPKWSRENLTDEDVAKWYGNGSRAAAVYFLNRPETIAVSDFYIGVVNVAPWIPRDHPMHRKPLDEIYRYLVNKYLCPHTLTHSACETFFRVHLEGAPFVAVHMRGSDKIIEDRNLHATNQSFLSALASINPTWPIFLLTDDEQCRARTKTVYGDRVITTSCQRTNTSTGVHYLSSVNRVQAGLEVMTDTFLALRANRFIGNGQSNVSAMIAVMKEWGPGACTLIDRSLLMERNLYIHIKQR